MNREEKINCELLQIQLLIFIEKVRVLFNNIESKTVHHGFMSGSGMLSLDKEGIMSKTAFSGKVSFFT